MIEPDARQEPTRLATLSDAVMEAGWLAALVVGPLFFNEQTSRIFEPEKALTLQVIAVLIAVAAVVSWLGSRHRPRPDLLRPMGIPLAVLALVAGTLAATVFSVDPYRSIWGSFERLHGLVTMLALIVPFVAVAWKLRTRRQFERIVSVCIGAGTAAAGYGLLQSIGLDPVNWEAGGSARVTSSLGNPTFLAGLLIMVIPLSLYRLAGATGVGKVVYGGATTTLLAALLVTQGRASVLAVAVALLAFGLLWSLCTGNRRSAGLIIVIAVLVAAGIGVSQNRYHSSDDTDEKVAVNRLTRMTDAESGSGRIRILVWQGIATLMLDQPKRVLVGYGPESLRSVLPRHISAELENRSNAIPDRAHNDTLDRLAMTGLASTLGWLWLVIGVLASVVVVSIRTDHQETVMAASAVGAALLAHVLESQLGIGTVASTSYFWILSGAAVALALREVTSDQSSDGSTYPLVLFLGWCGATLAAPLLASGVGTPLTWPAVVLVALIWMMGFSIEAVTPIRSKRSALLMLSSIPILGLLAVKLLLLETGLGAVVGHWLYPGATVVLISCVAFSTIRASETTIPRLSAFRTVGLSLGLLAVLVTIWFTGQASKADVMLRQSQSVGMLGDLASSERFAREAVAIAPRRPAYGLNLGRVLVSQGAFDEAEAVLVETASLDRLNSDHLANLGRLYIRWWQSDPHAPGAPQRAARALASYDDAITLRPSFGQLWMERGIASIAAGDSSSALASFRKSTTLDPELTEAHIQTGNVLRGASNWRGAADAYRMALATTPNEELRIALEAAAGEMERLAGSTE